MKLLYLLLLLSVFFSSCNGQEKKLNDVEEKTVPTRDMKIITTQGSPNAGINCGLQDRAGNIWFCTAGEGVYRYDGKVFTNFTEKDGLSDNTVWAIIEDKAGNIWFGTKAGPCRYDGKTFTGIPITESGGSNYDPIAGKTSIVSQQQVWSMLQDRTGRIWFGTHDGAFSYDGKTFTRFLDNDGVINKDNVRLKWIESILEDKAGNIWFGGRTNESLCRFDGKSVIGFQPGSHKWMKPIFEDKVGNIWFGFPNYRVLYRYDGKTFTDFSQKETLGGVSSIVEDKGGNLWFNARTGVWRYNGNNEDNVNKKDHANLSQFFTKFLSKDDSDDNVVRCILEDMDGNFWFSAAKTGLIRYDIRCGAITNVNTNDRKEWNNCITDFSDTACKNIRRIFEDRVGNIWFGTNGEGVYRYSSKSFTRFGIKEGLSGTDIRCMAEDKNGNIWFGTNAGVSAYDGKRFTHFTIKDGLANNDIWSMLIDRAGTVWVGTLEGVSRYDTKAAGSSKPFTAFSIPAAEENDFSREVSGIRIVWDIKEDKAGNIWFATNGRGVYRYDGKSLTNISKEDGLCGNFVSCILEDKKGNLWFAAQHAGVSRYNPTAAKNTGTKPFTNFTYKDGLCNGDVWTMAEDRAGNIWFAANYMHYPSTHSANICRYDAKTFTAVKDKEELLDANYVQSIFEDRKGRLWLSCTGGLCRFDEQSFINLTKAWTLRVL